MQISITDVLSDLMHMASRQRELGLGFDDCLRMAKWHYEAETEEEFAV